MLRASKRAYRGFHTEPLDWAAAREKFDVLTAPFATAGLRDQIADIVHHLEDHRVADLTAALAQVNRTRKALDRARSA